MLSFPFHPLPLYSFISLSPSPSKIKGTLDVCIDLLGQGVGPPGMGTLRLGVENPTNSPPPPPYESQVLSVLCMVYPANISVVTDGTELLKDLSSLKVQSPLTPHLKGLHMYKLNGGKILTVVLNCRVLTECIVLTVEPLYYRPPLKVS